MRRGSSYARAGASASPSRCGPWASTRSISTTSFLAAAVEPAEVIMPGNTPSGPDCIRGTVGNADDFLSDDEPGCGEDGPPGPEPTPHPGPDDDPTPYRDVGNRQT